MRKIIATGLLLVAAGCASPESPPPLNNTVPSTPVGTSTSAAPVGDVPKVLNPLPASVLAGDPCAEALTAEQLKQALGIAPQGRPDQIANGPKCSWDNQQTNAYVAVFYHTKIRAGLSDAYRNVRPKAAVWRELAPIQGFPAVAYTTSAGSGPPDLCSVSVGLADDLSFGIGVFLSDAKKGKADPCDGAAKVADLVVTNLRKKAGA